MCLHTERQKAVRACSSLHKSVPAYIQEPSRTGLRWHCFKASLCSCCPEMPAVIVRFGRLLECHMLSQGRFDCLVWAYLKALRPSMSCTTWDWQSAN